MPIPSIEHVCAFMPQASSPHRPLLPKARFTMSSSDPNKNPADQPKWQDWLVFQTEAKEAEEVLTRPEHWMVFKGAEKEEAAEKEDKEEAEKEEVEKEEAEKEEAKVAEPKPVFIGQHSVTYNDVHPNKSKDVRLEDPKNPFEDLTAASEKEHLIAAEKLAKQSALLWRGKLCTFFMASRCRNFLNCNFAHCSDELRFPDERCGRWRKVWEEGEVDKSIWPNSIYEPNPKSKERFKTYFLWERRTKESESEIPDWAWGLAVHRGLCSKDQVPERVHADYNWPNLQKAFQSGQLFLNESDSPGREAKHRKWQQTRAALPKSSAASSSGSLPPKQQGPPPLPKHSGGAPGDQSAGPPPKRQGTPPPPPGPPPPPPGPPPAPPKRQGPPPAPPKQQGAEFPPPGLPRTKSSKYNKIGQGAKHSP